MSIPWHVLGAGSIGCLFASELASAGRDTILLSRNHASLPGRRTVTIHRKLSGTHSTQSFDFKLSSNTATDPIEQLLVTTKTYDVHNAIRQVAHRLSEHSTIVILVNGMGFLAPIQREFPALELSLGTTTEGAYRIDDKQFFHAGRGTTQIGRAGCEHAPTWFSNWSRLSLECNWTANIDEVLWQKLALNCAINPLTAKHRCRNGDLAIPEIAAEVSALCDEIAEVSRAEGYHSIADCIHQNARDVIAATAENKSSMLQDTLAGQRTEIEYLSGYLLERAAAHAVATPQNAALYQHIRNIDSPTASNRPQ